MGQHPADRPRHPLLLPLGGGPKHREDELCSPACRALRRLLAECTVPGAAASLVHKFNLVHLTRTSRDYVLTLGKNDQDFKHSQEGGDYFSLASFSHHKAK